jgi:hypothetical protein
MQKRKMEKKGTTTHTLMITCKLVGDVELPDNPVTLCMLICELGRKPKE